MRWSKLSARPSFLSSLLGGLLLGLVAAACTGDQDFGNRGKGGSGQCPALSYEEMKEVCHQAFTDCLHTHIQSIPSGRSKHSQCVFCRDLCMQAGGVWPNRAHGGQCL